MFYFNKSGSLYVLGIGFKVLVLGRMAGVTPVGRDWGCSVLETAGSTLLE